MKTTLLNAKQIGQHMARLIDQATELYWAVAWGSNGPMADRLLHHNRKIQKVLIGTHFCQTHPELLRRLSSHSGARVALNLDGTTFHPKMYFFRGSDFSAAIVGSANFTNGGMGKNDEAAILFEGTDKDEPIQAVFGAIELLWKRGSKITENYLASYTLQHAATRRARKALQAPTRVVTPRTTAKHPDLLLQSWTTFHNNVITTDQHGIDQRLEILRKARDLFLRKDSFSKFVELERKAVAGTIGVNEVSNAPELLPNHWGYFGSMIGAGDFKKLIRLNSQPLSDALDNIPMQGEVAEEDYVLFVKDFRRAFAHATRKGGIATASRLLAIKRPDYFVCIDSKNRDGLGADLGFAPQSLNFDDYWIKVVEPITQAVWWQTRRPVGRAGRVWDARAAMLDSLYYDYEN